MLVMALGLSIQIFPAKDNICICMYSEEREKKILTHEFPVMPAGVKEKRKEIKKFKTSKRVEEECNKFNNFVRA